VTTAGSEDLPSHGHESEPSAKPSPEADVSSSEAQLPAAGAAGEGGESASSNPLGEDLDFSLSVPPIEVRMVNAAALEDYEIWFLTSSIVGSAAIGFLVAFIQSFHEDRPGNNHGDVTLLIVCLVFTVLLGIAAGRAIILRRRIKSQSKTYSMKASASSVPKLDE